MNYFDLQVKNKMKEQVESIAQYYFLIKNIELKIREKIIEFSNSLKKEDLYTKNNFILSYLYPI